MTRQIKFRAWDKENKVMRNVRELSFDDDSTLHGLLSENEGENTLGRVFLGEPVMVDVGNENHPEGWLDDYPLMQFTGLLDKNGKGKEIYEGDILLNKNWNMDAGAYEEWKTQVMWDANEGRWDGIDGERVEVIGNIYENKELLDKKK